DRLVGIVAAAEADRRERLVVRGHADRVVDRRRAGLLLTLILARLALAEVDLLDRPAAAGAEQRQDGHEQRARTHHPYMAAHARAFTNKEGDPGRPPSRSHARRPHCGWMPQELTSL